MSAAQQANFEASEERAAFRDAGWPEPEWQERRKQSEARAEGLLLRHLRSEQQRDYREQGWFDVRGSIGGMYRVRRGRAHNVLEMDDGAAVASWCIRPEGWVPAPDACLAQKLLLESDEAEFRRIANRTPADAAWM